MCSFAHRHCLRSRTWLTIVAALLVLVSLTTSSASLQAQSPTPTPTAPGSGGTTFGVVRVLSGNELPRNSGQENEPPVWITIDAKGTSAVVTVGNATRVPLDFNGTVVISLSPGASAVTTAVSTGAAVIQGNQVIWSGFSLEAGQIVPAIVVLAAGSQPAAPAATAIQGVSIDAKATQTGAVINELAAGGGPSLPALAAAPSPAAGLNTAGRAGSASLGPVTPLSRADGQRYAAWMLALLLALLALIAAAISLIWRTGHRLQSQLATLNVSSGPGDPVLAHSEMHTARQPIDRAGEHAAGWWLEPMNGSGPRQHWTLAAPEIAIGRNPSSDIVVPDPRVSDKHARLVRQTDGGYQLIDDGSTNGTDVNGERISVPVRLRENDVLRVGSTSFIVQHAADN